MKSSVLTVSQVNLFLKSLIETDGRLNDIMISGEISNFTHHYRSGHLYFTLKDDKSVLKSVMFSGSAKRLKFMPSDGMKVIVRGRISVYEPSGQYQLYAEDIQPYGIGALSVFYEQLKSKLEEEGLFSPEYKKPIPKYPSAIGVITSPTGAAIRDILQITGRRWPLAEIIVSPVLVQGDGAAKELINALRDLNRAECCDVIILGRGGGSLEDLWAFNDEELAREIFASEIPVVSAVGHETDFTICDFVSDMRAPTPSAAAELCTPDISEEALLVDSYIRFFSEKPIEYINFLRQKLDDLTLNSCLGHADRYFEPVFRELSSSTDKLYAAAKNMLFFEKDKLSVLSASLDALSPLKVLSRGYTVVLDSDKKIIRRAKDINRSERFTVKFSDDEVTVKVCDE